MENFDKEIEKAAKPYFGIKGAYLAGGAITSVFTNKPIKDYDLYFKDKMSFVRAVDSAYEDGWYCLAHTDRAITFSDSGTVVQLMSFDWFPTAQSIFDKYDFTVCMAAIDLESKEFFRHPNFLTDLAKRAIKFNHGTEFPLASAMRVIKYKEKGFEIDPSEYLKILLAIIFKNPQNWDELSSQVGGQYGAALQVKDDMEFSLENAIKVFEEKLNTISAEIEPPILGGSADFMSAMTQLYGAEEAKQLDELLTKESEKK